MSTVIQDQSIGFGCCWYQVFEAERVPLDLSGTRNLADGPLRVDHPAREFKHREKENSHSKTVHTIKEPITKLNEQNIT